MMSPHEGHLSIDGSHKQQSEWQKTHHVFDPSLKWWYRARNAADGSSA
jgi:hypothetical protein